jgi:hypothetical protein
VTQWVLREGRLYAVLSQWDSGTRGTVSCGPFGIVLQAHKLERVGCGYTGRSLQADAKKNPIGETPPPPHTWSVNLYDGSVTRYQNPDLNGCAAAATVSMLNLIALTPQTDTPPPRGDNLAKFTFRWTIDKSWNQQEWIMWFERNHMSMSRDTKGSDPHGWRNGLNYFGWGSLNADVYRDVSYSTFTSATHAVVDSIARTNKPAGILAWSGAHAQYVTGYTVRGEDPRISDNYTIVAVWISDPLHVEAMPNSYISLATLKSGGPAIRFTKYTQTGSLFPDSIDHQIGDKEWHNKWVVIEPVK